MAVHGTNKWTSSRKAGGVPRVSRSILSVRMNKPTRDETGGPVSRDKFSGANEDRKKSVPVQLDHEQDLQSYSVDLFHILLFD